MNATGVFHLIPRLDQPNNVCCKQAVHAFNEDYTRFEDIYEKIDKTKHNQFLLMHIYKNFLIRFIL